MTSKYWLRVEGLEPTLGFDTYENREQFMRLLHGAIIRGNTEGAPYEPDMKTFTVHVRDTETEEKEP